MVRITSAMEEGLDFIIPTPALLPSNRQLLLKGFFKRWGYSSLKGGLPSMCEALRLKNMPFEISHGVGSQFPGPRWEPTLALPEGPG